MTNQHMNWEGRWQEPPDPPPQGHWIDPHRDSQGILAADEIRFYAESVNMIFPFDKKWLKPAGYELTLGPRYQIEGKDGFLTDQDPILVIPPNSIAFVSMNERLMLPHYIVARFNLSIDLIYQGLLLGTGPQVDPGFKGVLSCPLHNISNNPIRIRLGNSFAKIDFAKTTGFARGTAKVEEEVKDEKALYQKSQRDELLGFDERPVPLFNKSKCWREPILDYEPGRTKVSSSVAPLAAMVRRWSLLGFVGMAGFVAITVALIGLAATLFNLYCSAKAERDSMKAAVESTTASLKENTDQLKAMREDLTRLRAELETHKREAADAKDRPDLLMKETKPTLVPDAAPK